MKYAALLLCFLLLACQQSPPQIIDTEPGGQPAVNVPTLVDEPIVNGEVLTYNNTVKPEVEMPTQIDMSEIKPLLCGQLQNMSSSNAAAMGEHMALAVAVGTDALKKGVYDLGYLLPTNYFKIGRQALKDRVPISLKLRGPGSIKSEPMDLMFQCDNRTFNVMLPAMDAETIFYVDTFGRIYWRDTDHDGTGETMDALKALQEEHRVAQ